MVVIYKRIMHDSRKGTLDLPLGLLKVGISAPKLQPTKSESDHNRRRGGRGRIRSWPLEVVPEKGEAGVGDEGSRVLLPRFHELPKIADLGGVHGLLVHLLMRAGLGVWRYDD